MLRVAAFTGGLDVPSARFRVRQYISVLSELGIAVDELIAPLGSFPPAIKWLRPFWGAATLACDLPHIAQSWRYDACLLQREFVSTLATLEFLASRPRFLDVDDAIFLHRGGRPARRLAQTCDAVICGNAYLADWFGRWNRRTSVVPTAINTDSYCPRHDPVPREVRVIGWIGTSSNFRYLLTIQGALARVFAARPRARLRIVSDRPPHLPALPADRIEFVRWTQRREILDIQSMDVGIMPLDDSAWARGKCSFKMLQYMACGLPVVVSPVGMNAEVLAKGACGIGASSEAEWVEALIALLDNEELCTHFGAGGRFLAQSHFSITTVAPTLARLLLGR